MEAEKPSDTLVSYRNITLRQNLQDLDSYVVVILLTDT